MSHAHRSSLGVAQLAVQHHRSVMSTSCSRETRSSEHGVGSLISRSPSSSSRASSAMSSSRQGSARSTQGSSGTRGSTRSTSRTASYTATRSASSSCNEKSKSVSLSHSLDEDTRQPEKIDRVPTPGPGVPRSVETRVATPFGFSNSHPVIPRRYVPPWQLDMKNRQLTIEVSLQLNT